MIAIVGGFAGKRGRCRGALPSLTVALAIAAASPVFAQDSGSSTTSAEDRNFQSLNADIERLQQIIAELAPGLDSTEGLERRIAEARLGKAKMELLERNLEYTRAAARL